MSSNINFAPGDKIKLWLRFKFFNFKCNCCTPHDKAIILFTFWPFWVWAVTESGTDVCAFCCLTGAWYTPAAVAACLPAWTTRRWLCTPPRPGPRVAGTTAAAAGHRTRTATEAATAAAALAWPPATALLPCRFRGPSYRCRWSRYR